MPKELTQEYVRNLLDYNPETGVFIVRHVEGDGPKHRNKQAGNIAGTINDHGYRILMIDNKRYRAHHIAWLYMNGVLPNLVDHRDGHPSNNAIDNLRLASTRQNSANMKIKKNNKTGLKGVAFYPNAKSKKWRAKIKYNYNDIVLGMFDCPAAAHFAYIVAAEKLHGEFARFA